MNASVDSVTAPVAARTAPHATHRFRLLLRREYWENRGGIFWAPVIAGLLSTLLSAGLLIVGIWFAHKSVAEGGSIQHNGVSLNGLDLAGLAQLMSQDDIRQISEGLALTLTLSASWPWLVMIFVAFFYCLGALYDDRRDRSVLFWKSLPISDTSTVLSKVVTATVTIPVFATAAAIVTAFLFLVMLSIAIAAHGANPIPFLWTDGTFLRFVMVSVAVLPVYALWAMPTVGWLLMCSAWAKSKPFLWAVLIPLGLGVATSMTGLLQLFGIERHWLWANVITRLLLGTAPMTGSDLEALGEAMQSGAQPLDLMTVQGFYSNFAAPSMWIGILAGIVMIVIAIRLRRWREEG